MTDWVIANLQSCDKVKIVKFKKTDRLKLIWNDGTGRRASFGLRDHVEAYPDIMDIIKDKLEGRGEE